MEGIVNMGKEYISPKKMRELEEFIVSISRELITSENIIEKIEILKKIYDGNATRHLYSRIFSILAAINDYKNDKEYKENEKNFDLNKTKQNILYIYGFVIKNHPEEEFQFNVIKLYDHINLDIARIEYTEGIDRKTEETRKELEKNKIKTEDEIAELLLKSNELKEDLDKQLKNSKGMQEKIEEQIEITENLEKNLKDYNKEVFGIMGVFLTIFSIIGINFDVYKAISELSLSKILLLFVGINLSLFLILNFMFGFIKDILISKNVPTTNKNNYFWYTFAGLLIIGIVIVINMRYVPETRVQKIIELEKKVKILEEKLNQQK